MTDQPKDLNWKVSTHTLTIQARVDDAGWREIGYCNLPEGVVGIYQVSSTLDKKYRYCTLEFVYGGREYRRL